MDAVFPPPPPPQGLARILGLGRLRFTLGLTLLLGLLISLGWKSGLPSILLRTVTLGLLALLVFGLFEQWPRHLPAWLARWVLPFGEDARVLSPEQPRRYIADLCAEAVSAYRT